MSLTVIKLGGSLMQSKELPEWLDQIALFAKDTNIIIVPGGGKFADEVRKKQAVEGFDDKHAHRMALHAMTKCAYFLANLNSAIELTDELELVESSFNNKPLLWIPTCLLDDYSEIPASWDYTSDSIALWLAIKLQAPNLVIVKSIAKEDANENYLDKGFKQLLNKFSGKLSCMNKVEYEKLNNVY